MRFIVDGKPMGKQRPRVTVRNGYARAYTPEKTVNYETLIKYAFMSVQNDIDYLKPCKVEIKAIYDIPKSKPKKWQLKALDDGIRPTVKPDTDNIAKIVCDALNGLAYKDDCQVVELKVEKFYGDKPCVIVEIENI